MIDLAKIKIVPKEEWKIVKKYISGGEYGSGVVLIPESVLEEITERKTVSIIKDLNDEEYMDYEFGGDADVWVDVVLSKKHLFVKDIESKIEEEKEDDDDDDDDE
jgi:hypothetical protein